MIILEIYEYWILGNIGSIIFTFTKSSENELKFNVKVKFEDEL